MNVRYTETKEKNEEHYFQRIDKKGVKIKITPFYVKKENLKSKTKEIKYFLYKIIGFRRKIRNFLLYLSINKANFFKLDITKIRNINVGSYLIL